MWRSERASRFALTMRSGLSVVGGFFLRAILALIPALTVWYLAQEWLIEPVAWLTERTMLYFFPNWVLGAELEGVNLVLLTTIRVPQVSGAASAQMSMLTSTSVSAACAGVLDRAMEARPAMPAAHRARGRLLGNVSGMMAICPLSTFSGCPNGIFLVLRHSQKEHGVYPWRYSINNWPSGL